MLETEIAIINNRGLHARASAKLSDLAAEFNADIHIIFHDQKADAKNILQLMMLAAAKGSVLTLTCSGSDEKQATDAILTLINNFFDEGD